MHRIITAASLTAAAFAATAVLGALPAAMASTTNLMATPGRYCNALALQPGDRILVQPGRIETVVAETEVDQYGGLLIQTLESDIITGPCAVKVVS